MKKALLFFCASTLISLKSLSMQPFMLIVPPALLLSGYDTYRIAQEHKKMSQNLISQKQSQIKECNELLFLLDTNPTYVATENERVFIPSAKIFGNLKIDCYKDSEKNIDIRLHYNQKSHNLPIKLEIIKPDKRIHEIHYDYSICKTFKGLPNDSIFMGFVQRICKESDKKKKNESYMIKLKEETIKNIEELKREYRKYLRSRLIRAHFNLSLAMSFGVGLAYLVSQ